LRNGLSFEKTGFLQGVSEFVIVRTKAISIGERKPLYWSKIKSGEYKPGFACDDRAGIYFENEEVKEVVSLNEKSNAYFVSMVGGEVKETAFQKKLL
jgi:hypothetical protein